MSTSMRKVDRLMLQVSTAMKSADLEFMYAVVSPARYSEFVDEGSPNYDKWEVLAFLSRGATGRSIVHSDVTKLEPIYFDTYEEAMEAVKEIEDAHTPTDKRVQKNDHLYITIGV